MAGGIRAVGLAVRANPLGLLITGMMVLYSTCEPVRAVFDSVFGHIGNIISSVWQKIKGFGDTLKSLGKWAGFGGDDEEEAETVNPEAVVPPPKAVVPPLPPVPQGSPFVLPAPYTASPSSSQAGQPVSQGQLPGTPVTANFSFQMNGIPDRDFAERVVQAIQERRSEFEQLLDRIVRDQQRAAYGI